MQSFTSLSSSFLIWEAKVLNSCFKKLKILLRFTRKRQLNFIELLLRLSLLCVYLPRMSHSLLCLELTSGMPSSSRKPSQTTFLARLGPLFWDP